MSNSGTFSCFNESLFKSLSTSVNSLQSIGNESSKLENFKRSYVRVSLEQALDFINSKIDYLHFSKNINIYMSRIIYSRNVTKMRKIEKKEKYFCLEDFHMQHECSIFQSCLYK